ncbi:hypothetical protein DLAC_08132 [Tieghemostelium lacteum]|uniref:Uncharacterized protein n=1 Tax=Tieghemostelium lacteum TaxID=361077 RepID=A0A151ZB90_TIELA|nr:hypothetical protein DLAC_08132 [Tieghemostelium lacteum]|eukprot:KYQ91209.1 hypothetical protein DLAC_08132 [Tieghemostelium lacteum]
MNIIIILILLITLSHQTFGGKTYIDDIQCDETTCVLQGNNFGTAHNGTLLMGDIIYNDNTSFIYYNNTYIKIENYQLKLTQVLFNLTVFNESTTYLYKFKPMIKILINWS